MSIEKIKKVTCIICMSKHPTKTVTDARKSKTVLKKSVNVLHYLASVTTHSKQPSTPLEIKKGIHLVEGGRREIEKKWDGSHTFYTLL